MKYGPAIFFIALAGACLGYALMPTGRNEVGVNLLAIYPGVVGLLAAGMLLIGALFR